MRSAIAAAVLAVCLPLPAGAQDNTIDGLDVKMYEISALTAVGRNGTFPNGRNGISFQTTCCNPGSVDVPWLAAMDRNHPFIAFGVFRETDGQFFQISDYSYVKHGFASINADLCAGTCRSSDSRELGVNCSDTYGVGNNSDRYWLGPPEEIDPWLGDWEPVCSYFDAGDPAVSPPNDCDGNRSLSDSQVSNMGPIKNRIRVRDEDLNVPDSRYFFYGVYVVRGEAEGERFNNSMTREFFPTWGGNSWSFPLAPFDENKRGSMLRMWDGANLSSASNGEFDGRAYVGAKVSGPDGDGFYRYEYAVHNRDMLRGVGGITLPVRPGATIRDYGFHDIDSNANNEWELSQHGSTLFIGRPDRHSPVVWNTVANFWFEADVAPARASSLMHVHDAGPGADVLSLELRAPVGPIKSLDLGLAKAGGNGLNPSFLISGSFATGEQADFQLRFAEPNSGLVFIVSDESNPTPFNGGTLLPLPIRFIRFFSTDAQGTYQDSVPGQGWGGPPLYAQFVVFDPTADDSTALSNAVEFSLD